MDFLRRTWAEISKSALINNLSEIATRAGTAEIMAVVKANAYGHNVRIVAPLLEQCGADRFAVSNINEAIELRECGITRPVLILGYTPASFARQLAKNNISQCVYSYDYARELSESAVAAGVSLSVHLKLDTGMARLGFDLRDEDLTGLPEALAAARLPGLTPDGVFTHFAAADSDSEESAAYTDSQYSRFIAGVKKIKDECGENILVHCDNSAALCRNKYALDCVRPGIILYGLTPDRDFDPRLKLIPVMTVKSVITFVKTVKKGTAVSYGMTYRADRDMKIATVAAGYADGYPRALSNKGEVLLHGKRAKILGRVCMDQFMIDVTDIEGASTGDEVVLFGRDLPVNELAKICDTINYEIVCGISPRVPKLPVD